MQPHTYDDLEDANFFDCDPVPDVDGEPWDFELDYPEDEDDDDD